MDIPVQEVPEGFFFFEDLQSCFFQLIPVIRVKKIVKVLSQYFLRFITQYLVHDGTHIRVFSAAVHFPYPFKSIFRNITKTFFTALQCFFSFFAVRDVVGDLYDTLKRSLAVEQRVTAEYKMSVEMGFIYFILVSKAVILGFCMGAVGGRGIDSVKDFVAWPANQIFSFDPKFF